jgi:hypothetical protein
VNPFDLLTAGFLENVVGGTWAQAGLVGFLVLIVVIVAILLAARVGLEFALVIVSPAIIAASFAGVLPPLAFGVVVLLVGLFFGGVILALAR